MSYVLNVKHFELYGFSAIQNKYYYIIIIDNVASVRPHSQTPDIFMRRGRLVMYCANVLFGCVIIDELLGRTR